MTKCIAKVTGLNFYDLETPENAKILKFRDIEGLIDSKNIIINSSSFYEIIIYNDLKLFTIRSSMLKKIENEIKYSSIIKEAVCSEETVYFLHTDGNLSHYNVQTKELLPISLTALKNPNESIAYISATLKSLYGISNKNCLYQLSPEINLIHEFKPYQKVKKISSGLEHTLILTNNGDIYGFGCNLRGQIGVGIMSVEESLKLIEALGGIKIIDIACSAFSSIAVSSFGDVYSFGWNKNGQLGIKKTNVKQVYALPELVESPNDLKFIYCGYKHAILRTENNQLFASGLNNYGQLGINSAMEEIDEFREINVHNIDDKTVIFCGYWNSYIIKNI